MNASLARRKAPAGAVHDVMESLQDDPSIRVRLIAAGSLLAADPDHGHARQVAEAARTDASPRVRQAAEDLLQSLDVPTETAVAVGPDTPAPPEVIPLAP